MTVGYLVPEFPGQTHIFLWRERGALASLGVDAAWISTRRPPRAIFAHEWAAQAEGETDYLFPLAGTDLPAIALELVRSGPLGWFRCLRTALRGSRSPKGVLRLVAMVPFAAKLSALARRRGWRHIHVHSCADAANIALLARRLSGLPYSLTLHGPTLEGYGDNQEQKWAGAEFALVISHGLLATVRERLGAAVPARAEVAPMGVNLDVVQRRRPYVAWAPGEPCRLFCCARLNAIKGHPDLLEALRIVRASGIDARLTIAGEDESGGQGYHRELAARIADMGLTPYVELLGAVSEERVREGLEQAHAFVLASLNEGVPVSVMEAMAMEVPVVTTDVGGTAELVDDGRDGLLVPSRDPAAFAQALTRVLRDAALAGALSGASRAKIAARFHHRCSAEALARCLVERGAIPDMRAEVARA
jgi:glycosyltransferase involved in cell wall biosynthesis